MSKAPGGGEGVHGQLVELSVVCSWVCFGKSSQIYFQLDRIKLFLSLNVKTSQENEKPALKL